MGIDYFYNQANNNDLVESRSIFFTNMSRGRLSRNKSFSNDKNITKKSNNTLFKTDLTNISTKTSISNFLSSKGNIESVINKNENLSENNSSSSSSTIEETKITNLFNKKKEIFSLINKSESIRKSYYYKLLNKDILNINKENIKNNTLFIFDWDDTLFFTTHLNPSKNNLFFYENANEKKIMETIESYIEEILNKSLSKGTVLIITNSSKGWVESCAKFYYPNLIPILKKIYIISARELYSEKYPGDPLTWKINAFNDLKERFNFIKCKITNIICIGDDNSEIIAAKKLGESINECLVKTIKFRDAPKLKELIKQLILINDQILRVYKYPKNLTIQVNKKKNPKK